jgi:hypothetical protein
MSVAYLLNGEWVDANGKPVAAPEVAPEVGASDPEPKAAPEPEEEKPKRKRG